MTDINSDSFENEFSDSDDSDEGVDLLKPAIFK